MWQWLQAWLDERIEAALVVFVTVLVVLYLLAPLAPRFVALAVFPITLAFGVSLVVAGLRNLFRR